MLFAHDTEVSLASTAALINTLPGASKSGDDELSTPAQLVQFLDRNEFTGSRTGATEELDDVRALRGRLRELWTHDEDGVVALVNELLQEAHALPQLVKHDHWDWHLHATESSAPVAHRLQVETAMAVIDVVRAKELDRLHECAADDCTAVVVDLSRNRSKRYCDVGNCGNRMHVAAYRARLRGEKVSERI
ncbi:putative RNA-binding Zn ribbon-like protein [Okibacterium sp. HSC-33S16]|uniref:CGNR zinc finger domain-containing protein n=1 Tax=Okibacterium sp. HSC-33S16 TaxID=2910965 RepID=UPI0020A0EF13|nr:CGNR zinc finger domain-containing protein [Okibacterium sp. HSC-33S16]MCP2030080.1 putative RNA-binding Zn ribbon-like protein [Okibacterium sp. HSC-33S16]